MGLIFSPSVTCFKGLLADIEKVFGSGGPHDRFKFQDDAAVARMAEWEMPLDSVKQIRDFAVQAKDLRLVSQVEFVFSYHALMKPFAECAIWWLKS